MFENPIWTTLLLIITGLIFAWIVTKLLNLTNNTAQASMVILPAVTYLLFSGALTDFSGLGFTAKFRAQSQTSIGKLSNAKQLAIKDKLADEVNYLRDATFFACRKYLLVKPDTLPSGNGPNFRRRLIDVAGSVRSSLLCGEFRALIFLDENNKVLKYFEPFLFYDLLPIQIVAFDENPPPAIWEAIKQTELAGMLTDKSYITYQSGREIFLNENATIAEGLQTLEKTNADVAVVTNAAGEFRGIISRQSIVEFLTLALLGVATDASDAKK